MSRRLTLDDKIVLQAQFVTKVQARFPIKQHPKFTVKFIAEWFRDNKGWQHNADEMLSIFSARCV